jgi:hypothetical protein
MGRCSLFDRKDERSHVGAERKRERSERRYEDQDHVERPILVDPYQLIQVEFVLTHFFKLPMSLSRPLRGQQPRLAHRML